jgi:hypothetical protein
MISQEQFVKNYEASLVLHDERVQAILEARRIAQAYALLLHGNFECNSQNINVLSLPSNKNRYFTDDELIEMTTKED